MDVNEQIREFGEGIRKQGTTVAAKKEMVATEEATKQSFIMPFLEELGFDVRDPEEVRPEYICDIAYKKGEKVDYAIFKDGELILLVECKHWRTKFEDAHVGQLRRYYNTKHCKFALLTNGIEYQFYSDLEEQNRMDKRPFLAFDITKITDAQIKELYKFSKKEFDPNKLAGAAVDMRFRSALRIAIMREFADPTEGLIRYLAGMTYDGNLTQKAMERITPIVTEIWKECLRDNANQRLKNAMEADAQKVEAETTEAKPDEASDGIVTTEEELQGFSIVKAIVCQKIPASRVVHRDAKTYFAILLDDKSTRPICRLYYNGKKKYLGLFNDASNFDGSGGAKSVRMVELTTDNPNDGIYDYVPDLLETIDYYLNILAPKATKPE